MTTAKRPPRKKPAPPGPKPLLVITKHRPKLKIQATFAHLRFTIPGFNWHCVAFAHALAGQVLIVAGEECWPWIMSPRIDPGDRLMTCTVVTIDMQLAAPDEIDRRMAVLVQHATAAVNQVVRPPGSREPSYDVVLELYLKKKSKES